MLFKGRRIRSRRSDYIYTMCKFHLCFTLLLCQIALRGYSPLEVYCTSLHYLYSAPFVPLHVSYAGFRLCVPLKCVFQVCRASWCVPLKACRERRSKKGSQFAARLVARYRRSQFYYNKNFFKMQMNILYASPHRYKNYLAFVLYVYRKIFSLFLFKIFW